MAKIEVKEDLCKGCRLCIDFCPKKSIGVAEHLNAKGFYPATQTDPDKCNACKICAMMCPDVAITVYK